MILPEIGLRTTSAGSILREAIDLIDFSFRLAKDADRIARGFESALRGLLIRDRLLHLALRNAVRRRKILGARQFFAGQFESRRRADQR